MLIRGFRVSNNESSWFFLFGFTSKTDFYTPILSQERMREMSELSGFFFIAGYFQIGIFLSIQRMFYDVKYLLKHVVLFVSGKAVPFVELTVAHASVLTILAISFERYYAICKPLKAGYICTKARASLICLLAWFIAAVFTR